MLLEDEVGKVLGVGDGQFEGIDTIAAIDSYVQKGDKSRIINTTTCLLLTAYKAFKS